MLRVALDCRPVLALCTIDVLPVLEEDQAESVVRVGMLWIALDRCLALALGTVDVLPVL
jgi:hypothetical protein